MPEPIKKIQRNVAVITLALCSAIALSSGNESLAFSQRALSERALSKSDEVLITQAPYCRRSDQSVEPSANLRPIELPQFGIVVQIPENYRALLRNDGTVWILDPATYEQVVCWAQGGPGGGLYAPSIRSIPNPNNRSLEAIASDFIQPGYFSQFYSSASGLSGVWIQSGPESRGFANAAFFTQVPGRQDVVEISVLCDCDVPVGDVTNFVESVSLHP